MLSRGLIVLLLSCAVALTEQASQLPDIITHGFFGTDPSGEHPHVALMQHLLKVPDVAPEKLPTFPLGALTAQKMLGQLVDSDAHHQVGKKSAAVLRGIVMEEVAVASKQLPVLQAGFNKKAATFWATPEAQKATGAAVKESQERFLSLYKLDRETYHRLLHAVLAYEQMKVKDRTPELHQALQNALNKHANWHLLMWQRIFSHGILKTMYGEDYVKRLLEITRDGKGATRPSQVSLVS